MGPPPPPPSASLQGEEVEWRGEEKEVEGQEEGEEEEFPPSPRREVEHPPQFPARPLRPGHGSGRSLKKGERLEMGEAEEVDVLHPSRRRTRARLLPRPPPLPPPPP